MTHTVYECMHQSRFDTPAMKTGCSTHYCQEPGSTDERHLGLISRLTGKHNKMNRNRNQVHYWGEFSMKREQAGDDDEMTDRQASHKASDLPVPECRFILNAVNTAGPSLKGQTDKHWLVLNYTVGQQWWICMLTKCWDTLIDCRIHQRVSAVKQCPGST